MPKKDEYTVPETTDGATAFPVEVEPMPVVVKEADCQFLTSGYYLVDGHLRDIIEGPFTQKFEAQRAQAERDAACGQGTCALLFVPCDGFAWG
jgi:hypothetical protein